MRNNILRYTIFHNKNLKDRDLHQHHEIHGYRLGALNRFRSVHYSWRWDTQDLTNLPIVRNTEQSGAPRHVPRIWNHHIQRRSRDQIWRLQRCHFVSQMTIEPACRQNAPNESDYPHARQNVQNLPPLIQEHEHHFQWHLTHSYPRLCDEILSNRGFHGHRSCRSAATKPLMEAQRRSLWERFADMASRTTPIARDPQSPVRKPISRMQSLLSLEHWCRKVDRGPVSRLQQYQMQVSTAAVDRPASKVHQKELNFIEKNLLGLFFIVRMSKFAVHTDLLCIFEISK